VVKIATFAKPETDIPDKIRVIYKLWASLKNQTVCESQRADHPM
jgi:hypothetical protein